MVKHPRKLACNLVLNPPPFIKDGPSKWCIHVALFFHFGPCFALYLK